MDSVKLRQWLRELLMHGVQSVMQVTRFFHEPVMELADTAHALIFYLKKANP